ncbi:MAG: hypothetical protein OWQ48_04325 [Desulfurococcus sp.]|nr:hypothetical protein [Desulfurococcus sp.]
MLIETPRVFLSRSDYLTILSSPNLEHAAGHLSGSFLAAYVGKLVSTHELNLKNLLATLDKGYMDVIEQLLENSGELRSRVEKVLWLLSSLDLYTTLNGLQKGVEPPLLTSPLPDLMVRRLGDLSPRALAERLPPEMQGMVSEYLKNKFVSPGQLVKAMGLLASSLSPLESYELGVLTGMLHDLLLIKASKVITDLKQLQPKPLALSQSELYSALDSEVEDLPGIISRARPLAKMFAEILSDSLKLSKGVEALDLAMYTGASYLASLTLRGFGVEDYIRLLFKLLGQLVLLKLSFTIVHSGFYRQEATLLVGKWVV